MGSIPENGVGMRSSRPLARISCMIVKEHFSHLLRFEQPKNQYCLPPKHVEYVFEHKFWILVSTLRELKYAGITRNYANITAGSWVRWKCLTEALRSTNRWRKEKRKSVNQKPESRLELLDVGFRFIIFDIGVHWANICQQFTNATRRTHLLYKYTRPAIWYSTFRTYRLWCPHYLHK